jgi:hypothetical protein
MILTLIILGAVALTAATVGTLLVVLHDRRIVKQANRDGTDLYIVKSDTRSEALRLTKAVILSAAGVYGSYVLLTFPLTNPGRQAICVLLTAVWTADILIAVNSFADLWSRHHSPHAPQSLKRDPGKSNP